MQRMPRQRPLWALCPILIAFVLLAGCATMGPSLEPPRISLVNIVQQPTSGMETAFQLELRLINPNDVPISLKGIDCRLEINDSTIASGVANEAAELPSLGTIVYPVTAYASASDFIFLMVRLMTESAGTPDNFELNYSLRGHVFLADGMPGLNRLLL